jgi:hypothetical protein
MPQIWMTYDEIADLLGCDADAARAQAMHRSLDRKKSRDGSTRVKLDLEWTARFIATIRKVDPALDQAIRELRVTGDAMSQGGGVAPGCKAMAHGSTSPRKADGSRTTAASHPAQKTGAAHQKSRLGRGA